MQVYTQNEKNNMPLGLEIYTFFKDTFEMYSVSIQFKSTF